MSTKQQTKPQYVNLQPSAVQVYDERRHPVTVLPWEMRHKNPNGLYVVEGVHYQKFVSGRGPLYPFPAGQGPTPGPLGETEDARNARLVAAANLRAQEERLDAAARPGKLRIAADVVRDGGIVGETQEAFAARLRPLLVAAGFATATQFRQASKESLFSVKGITEANLARVRELEPMLYADSVVEEIEEEPETGPDLEDLETTSNDGKPKPVAAAKAAPKPAVTMYSRKTIERMTRGQLVAVVEAENFEISVDGTAAQIRERLLAGLSQYKMLTP